MTITLTTFHLKGILIGFDKQRIFEILNYILKNKEVLGEWAQFKDLENHIEVNLLEKFIQFAILQQEDLDYKTDLFIKFNKIVSTCSADLMKLMTPIMCKLFIWA